MCLQAILHLDIEEKLDLHFLDYQSFSSNMDWKMVKDLVVKEMLCRAPGHIVIGQAEMALNKRGYVSIRYKLGLGEILCWESGQALQQDCTEKLCLHSSWQCSRPGVIKF